MEIAYKYFLMGDGLLVVFENDLPWSFGIPLQFFKENGTAYLRLADTHLVPLNDETLNFLGQTKKLYIATSARTAQKIDPRGSIEMDDVSIGKLIAYSELVV